MIKSYRRKFILSNMILSGIVLLVVFIVLGVVNYRQEYNNLESVMGIVLKPWNSHESSSVSDVSKAPKDKPQEKSRGASLLHVGLWCLLLFHILGTKVAIILEICNKIITFVV